MRALSGIQPTNILHIGNYFGALKPCVEMQEDHELFMLIVDLHAITVPQEPKKLSENIRFATAAYLAAGIDPKKTTLIQQSRVPAHAELSWLLQTIARMGELERMTQYKDKSAKFLNENNSVVFDLVNRQLERLDKELISDSIFNESTKESYRKTLYSDAFITKLITIVRDSIKNQSSVGLFTYPVLMAADILLYSAEGVPVGEDQKQHLELTRDLAERFNRDFGQTFVVPKPLIGKEGARILALDNPEKKMSKSAPSPKSYISLMDDADVIRKKIRSAVTDSEPTITYDNARPGVRNLLEIYSLATGKSAETLAQGYGEKGMGALKNDVAEALITHLAPLKESIQQYLGNPEELEKIIKEGSEKGEAVAQKKIKEVKEKMGLILAE
jgi:tryptophanyl-tRNA synthetase